ncbi:MAG: GH15 [uncultured Rubrobacteraceae bacterium]|uniref:GH15 n=1 Tax=uncultured Rubrobacteraceae bacterium TaxID=349277 RepID=A0A6J4QS49_9ACTN|nr:MAG: GH15 [uncultured Rubrobacteraceae bacterium]
MSTDATHLADQADDLVMGRSYPPIAAYGIIGAMTTCALVSKAGSIDWLCMPDFDSPAVFGRILDWRKGGYFQIAPQGVQSVERRYLPRTNVLETTFSTATGLATLTDFMVMELLDSSEQDDPTGNRFQLSGSFDVVLPTNKKLLPPIEQLRAGIPLHARYHQKVARIFECTEGKVSFAVECRPRFNYGRVTPHAVLIEEEKGTSNHAFARGGASAISLYCSTPVNIIDHAFHAEGSLRAGEKAHSVVTHQPFFLPIAEDFNEDKVERMLEETVRYWEHWSERCSYDGEYRDDVLRSALTLKALTFEPSGAILAAPTTSLPESPAGERNWDYRFTWIRDATLSLDALCGLGYKDEARAFKRWLEWTAAYPEDLQIMYGLRGERWLTEVELPLEGYKWSTPVRVGNGAYSQFQLDIYGEILDSTYIYRNVALARKEDSDNWGFETGTGLDPEEYETEPEYWEFLAAVVEFVIENWRRPDAGLWESRAGYRHFVYSKVMCWVALDRGIKIAGELAREQDGRERYGIDDEKLWRWESVREEIKDDVLSNGYDPNYKAGLGAFVQFYGSKSLDASSLRLPLIGFIEADHPMMRSTIEAIKQDLTSPEGFVYRYSTNDFDDGLQGKEGTFSICTFWLISNLIALGEMREARVLFETVRAYANDLGLFSEEINPETGEMLGNFPQAFSHLAFIDVAVELSRTMHASLSEQNKTERSSSILGSFPPEGDHRS